MLKERSGQVRKLLVALALLAPPLAFSQQQADSGSTQDPASLNPPQQTQNSNAEADAREGAPNPAATTLGLFARTLNSASPLGGDKGPLQWGWFSVRSASFLQYFNNVTLQNPGMPPVSQDVSGSEFSTSIVGSRTFGTSRPTELTIQYAPSLLVSNGNVYSNVLNQNAGVDTTFQLSPRWGLHLSDRFSYFGNQRYFSGLSLGVDYSQGTIAQNSFLNGPGRVIYNTVGAAFSYLWSPVTTVTFTPTFSYQNSTSAESNGRQELTGIYGGSAVTISHSLSATRTIGAIYSGQYATYTNTSKTAGPQSNDFQQDFLVTYGQKIGASWHLNVGLGLTSNTVGYSRIGLGASAGISKSLRRTDFAVNYYRGHQFNGYITSSGTDRIDLVNTIRWTRRFSSSTSVAHFRTTNSPTPGPSGTYAMEQLSFGLNRTLSFTGGFGYTKQTGEGIFVSNGHTRTAMVGITWTPAATVQY